MNTCHSFPAVLTCILLLLASTTPASGEETGTASDFGQATFGVRMGDETGEGFLDFLIPAIRSDNGVFFVNPRVALKNEGANEFNLGMGYRHLVGNDLAVVGANVYYDSRQSVHGNRFNQFGAGLEILGRWLDFRFNYYDADNSPQLYNQYTTTETTTATSTLVQNSTVTTTSYGEPYASGYALWVEQQITSTTRQTIRQITRTTETTRLFKEYEAGMDGFDTELGFLLPLPEEMPECRIFGGYYSYDNDFGEDIRGVKGRIEIRTGPYLTLDGEVFEDEELNGSSYFIGFRLQIPLKGSYTWEEIRKGLTRSAHPDLRRRMLSEMVIRDVRVQKEESGPVEERSALRRTETVTSKTIASTTRTSSGSNRLQVASDITFVDGDSRAPRQDGTAERPFRTIGGGVGHAAAGQTIFVAGMANRAYNEHVRLRPGQTLTSTIHLPAGIRSYTSETVPTIRPTSGSRAVVTMADNTTVQRVHVVADNGPGIHAPDGGAHRTITIRDSTITATGPGDAVWIEHHSGGSRVLLSNNTISTVRDGTYGIYINHENDHAPRVILEDNTVTTRGDQAHGVYLDHASTNDGVITAHGNTVTTWGRDCDGIFMGTWFSVNSSFVASGNTLTAEGDGPFGYGIQYVNTGAVGDRTNNTATDNTFGLIATMGIIDPVTLTLTAIAAPE